MNDLIDRKLAAFDAFLGMLMAPSLAPSRTSPVEFVSDAKWPTLVDTIDQLSCHPEPLRWVAHGQAGDDTARWRLRLLAALFPCTPEESAQLLLTVVANSGASLDIMRGVVKPVSRELSLAQIKGVIDSLSAGASKRQAALDNRVDRGSVDAIDNAVGASTAAGEREALVHQQLLDDLADHLAQGRSGREFGRLRGIAKSSVQRLMAELGKA